MKLISSLVMGFATASAITNVVLWAIVVGFNDKDVKICFGRPISPFNILMFFAAIANAAVVLLYLLDWFD